MKASLVCDDVEVINQRAVGVRQGESVSFMVSASDVADYEVDIVRIVCGEDDPTGPGCDTPIVARNVAGRVIARLQPVFCGSYGHVRGLRLAKSWPVIS